jgi:hypothetical protein
MQKCPAEVLKQIVCCFDLNSERDRKAAESAAVLFRAIAPIAQAELFRSVSLTREKRSNALLRALKQNGTLAKHTKCVEFWSGAILALARPKNKLCSHLAHVQRLLIFDFDFESADVIKRAFGNGRFKEVTSLVITRGTCTDSAVTALVGLFRGTLQHLKVTNTTITDDEGRHLSVSGCDRLQSLIIVETNVSFFLRAGNQVRDLFVHMGLQDDLDAGASAFKGTSLLKLERLTLDMAKGAIRKRFRFRSEDDYDEYVEDLGKWRGLCFIYTHMLTHET